MTAYARNTANFSHRGDGPAVWATPCIKAEAGPHTSRTDDPILSPDNEDRPPSFNRTWSPIRRVVSLRSPRSRPIQGTGASALSSPSCFNSDQKSAGIACRNTATLRRTCSGSSAPGIIEATELWPSGNCSAARQHRGDRRGRRGRRDPYRQQRFVDGARQAAAASTTRRSFRRSTAPSARPRRTASSPGSAACAMSPARLS